MQEEAQGWKYATGEVKGTSGGLCKQNAYKYLFNHGLSHISLSHYLCTFAMNQRRELSAFSSFFFPVYVTAW